jgi:transcriptional regulator with XRE-family HTH domain
MNVTMLTVYNWENQVNSPQAGNLDAIVALFGEESFDPENAPDVTSEGNLNLASWVFQKRQEKNWSRAVLAKTSGISEMAIWNIESGRTKNPRSTTIEKLEDALKSVVPEDLSADIVETADMHVEGVGPFTEFDPHDENDLPVVAGIYVFYDISERPIYVGQGEEMIKRIRDPHSGHWNKFWYRPPIVQTGAYVQIDDKTLREQIEAVMIKFMKSNAVINIKHVNR